MNAATANSPESTPAKRPVPPGFKPWAPGQSGNPAGRPPMDPALREALRKVHGPNAIALLANVVAGKVEGATTGDRLRAAETLIDRAWGRPAAAPGDSLADLAQALVLRFRRPDDPADAPRDITPQHGG